MKENFNISGSLLLHYNGTCQEPVIPSCVTEIAENAFDGCSFLTRVVIPEGVTKIGRAAFHGCTSLTSAVLPESLTEIGMLAFHSCHALQHIAIPNSVTEIGGAAFHGCTSLTSVVLPEHMTEISAAVFSGCTSLTSIVLPEGIVRIGAYAFDDCKALPAIVLPEGTAGIDACAFRNCSVLADISIPAGVTRIGSNAFAGCPVSPEWDSAFGTVFRKYCKNRTALTESRILIVPSGVTEIGTQAFSECRHLTGVVIPPSVKKIGAGAFSGCTSLTSVVILKGVTEIGADAFSGCTSLTSVVIPESVKKIDSRAFAGCPFRTFDIRDNVLLKYYGSKEEAVIPSHVKEIGKNAFRDCTSLKNVVIPPSVTKIGEYAFAGCISLKEIAIPPSVTEINTGAFGYCFRDDAQAIYQNPDFDMTVSPGTAGAYYMTAYMLDYIRNVRGIRYLIQFTPVGNLPNILEKGIIPRSRLIRTEKREKYIFTDSARIEGLEDYSCLSFSFPNYRMFFNKRMSMGIFAVLVIDVECLRNMESNDMIFSHHNAAANDAIKGSRLCDLRRMFEPSVTISGKVIKRSGLIPLSYTTNPQAELLVRKIIPPEYIKEIHFDPRVPVPEDFRYHPKCRIFQKYFDKREDWTLWSNSK